MTNLAEDGTCDYKCENKHATYFAIEGCHSNVAKLIGTYPWRQKCCQDVDGVVLNLDDRQ